MRCEKNLNGIWYNGETSVIVFRVKDFGSLEGCYYANISNPYNVYILHGMTNLHLKDTCIDAVLGFVVVWHNRHFGDFRSISVYSGQYQSIGDKAHIYIATMLTSEAGLRRSLFSIDIDTFIKIDDPSSSLQAKYRECTDILSTQYLIHGDL